MRGGISRTIGFLLRLGTKHLNLYLWSPGRIEGGLTVMHGFSTVVNASHIGRNFHVAQQVTIGWGPSGTPTIGNNVKVYAGAIIVGGITIGDNAIIGAGTAVVKDVPADTLVVGGCPNRLIKRTDSKVADDVKESAAKSQQTI
jgi:serine O-acetyltransferase